MEFYLNHVKFVARDNYEQKNQLICLIKGNLSALIIHQDNVNKVCEYLKIFI